MTLLMLRHAPSDLNQQGRWNGQLDPSLSAAAHAAIEQTCTRLREVLTDTAMVRVISSDLRRARETAELIALTLNIADVVETPDLRERDMGAWSGLSEEEAALGYPSDYQAWRAGELPAPPGGESDRSVAERAHRALSKWGGSRTGVAIVVTHAGVLQALAGIPSSTHERFPHLTGFWADMDDADNLTVGEPYPGFVNRTQPRPSLTTG